MKMHDFQNYTSSKTTFRRQQRKSPLIFWVFIKTPKKPEGDFENVHLETPLLSTTTCQQNSYLYTREHNDFDCGFE